MCAKGTNLAQDCPPFPPGLVYTGVYTEGHWVLAEQDRMGAVRRGRLRARCLRMYSGPGP